MCAFAAIPTASISFQTAGERLNHAGILSHRLHQRPDCRPASSIDATVWPEIPYETGWSTGTDDRVLRDLARYWRNDYDWFKTQERLNKLPHHRMPIEGEKIHFVWYRGSGARQKFPLLMMHGWPSTFLEFEAAAPFLTAGSDGRPGFDLVVPSLPGFVFSDAPRAAGMHPGRVADRMHLLMRALGYERYGVQGYDWGAHRGSPGSAVSRRCRRFPSPWRSLLTASFHRHSIRRGEGVSGKETEVPATGVAYSAIQNTKPQTLGYALQDSPVGLLSWILEKYWAWADHDGNLWDVISRDHVLTNVTLYWLTRRFSRPHGSTTKIPKRAVRPPRSRCQRGSSGCRTILSTLHRAHCGTPRMDTQTS